MKVSVNEFSRTFSYRPWETCSMCGQVIEPAEARRIAAWQAEQEADWQGVWWDLWAAYNDPERMLDGSTCERDRGVLRLLDASSGLAPWNPRFFTDEQEAVMTADPVRFGCVCCDEPAEGTQ